MASMGEVEPGVVVKYEKEGEVHENTVDRVLCESERIVGVDCSDLDYGVFPVSVSDLEVVEGSQEETKYDAGDKITYQPEFFNEFKILQGKVVHSYIERHREVIWVRRSDSRRKDHITDEQVIEGGDRISEESDDVRYEQTTLFT